MISATQKLSRLTPEQMKLLASRLAAKSASAARPEPNRIAMQPRDGRSFPLSFSQQRLWFLCQLAPDSVAYNTPIAVRLNLSEGQNFHPDLVEQALAQLVHRHESLRTVFAIDNGEPVQQLLASMQVPLVLHDLREIPGADRESRALASLQADASAPFDLERGPLLRVTVIRLGTFDWMLQINSHHLISDAWSLGVLLRELTIIVASRRMGAVPLLPALPIQHGDYAVWERTHLTGAVRERLLSYWQSRLSGRLPVLALPFRNHPGAATGVASGAMLFSTLNQALTSRVNAFARNQATTPFNVLLTAYKLLLRRYVRHDDVIVGTPVANRTREEVEGLIGCFINTLVLRTDFAEVDDFRDAVGRVTATTAGALAHGDYPFELLVAALRPDRDAGHTPLFQTMFTLQNAAIETAVPGGTMRLVEIDTGAAKFDLSLSAHELNGAYSLGWSYRADLMPALDIAAMADHYRILLEALLERPEQPVDHHALLDAAGMLRVTAMSSSHEALPEETIPSAFDQAFDAAALHAPDAAAVLCGGEALNYDTLRRRANALAHGLVAGGTAAGGIVAVLLERSPLSVLAILGVMKAGAAYLPIDPAWPQERIASIMAAAGTACAVVSPGLRSRLPQACAAFVLDPAWSFEEEAPPALDRHPADLAYVIFTSGTTGTPKGVAVEHRQINCYVRDISRRMALPPGARYAAVSTQAADLGHTMTFPALASGGTLMLVSDAMLDNPEALAAWFADTPPDALKIVPSHLGSLLDIEDPQRMLPRTLLVLGGEAYPPSLLARIAAIAPSCRILNHYGPTETTVGVITGEIDPRAPVGSSGGVRLGRPLDGARIYICDDALNPQPPGIPGELCIGGLTVARGYLGRPDLTADRFQADPQADRPGARLYRSGDLARWLPSGEIEFLGRIDDQVKIRGFRIEPAEVEAAMRRWPSANAAAVKAVMHNGATILAGWAAVGEAAIADRAALHKQLGDHLRATLPAAMIPSIIGIVAELPLTPNGKVDRAALQPDDIAPEPVSHFVAPRSSVELAMARLWEEVLERTPVGIDDDFFLLGGHSLLAVRLVALIRRRFGVVVPLAALFSHPTVARFARLVQRDEATGPRSPVVQIQSGVGRPLFFVHPAGGNVLCYYDLARALGPTQTLYGLQADTSSEAGDQGLSIVAMAAGYVEALRRAQPQGPYQIGGWSMGGIVAYEMASQLREAGATVSLLAIVDIPAPGRITRESRESIDDATALAIYARKLELFSDAKIGGAHIGLTAEALRPLSPEARVERLLQAMRESRLVPDEVTAEQIRSFVTMQKHHNYATLSYAPRRYDGCVTLIRANGVLAVREEAELLGLEALYEDEALGWRRHAEHVHVHAVNGNHVTMMTPPYVTEVAAVLGRFLESTTTEMSEAAA